MKIVINRCFGGFGLSDKAIELYITRTNKPTADYDIERNDPELVKIVEELGDEASGVHAKLRVIEVPDDVKWHIHEYDGNEHVAEDHQTWG